MIYLYAVTDRAGAPLPKRHGLAGAELCEASRRGLAAVYSAHDALQAEPTPDVLWTHEAVVEDLMRERTVLPMQFGTRLPDVEALGEMLGQRGDEFTRVLDGVRGRVELGVRIAGPGADPTPDPPATGSEYMAKRLGARREAERIAAAVHTPLARLAERSTTRQDPRGGDLMTGSYLLADDAVGRFTDELKELQQMHPELALTCTGPWPPYSFVEERQG